MASDGVFEFSPTFKEFLPVYRDVTRVWIGNGTTTGIDGMLYAEYADGSIAEIGSVSIYAIAHEQGYQGTPAQWVHAIVNVCNLIDSSQFTISYQVSTSGTVHPDPTTGWSPTPVFEKGKFTWAKIDIVWLDGGTKTFYLSTYQGQDGSVTSVNGSTGDVVLNGSNTPIQANSQTTIKEYIDEHATPETATNAEIDALFSNS